MNQWWLHVAPRFHREDSSRRYLGRDDCFLLIVWLFLAHEMIVPCSQGDLRDWRLHFAFWLYRSDISGGVRGCDMHAQGYGPAWWVRVPQQDLAVYSDSTAAATADKALQAPMPLDNLIACIYKIAPVHYIMKCYMIWMECSSSQCPLKFLASMYAYSTSSCHMYQSIVSTQGNAMRMMCLPVSRSVSAWEFSQWYSCTKVIMHWDRHWELSQWYSCTQVRTHWNWHWISVCGTAALKKECTQIDIWSLVCGTAIIK